MFDPLLFSKIREQLGSGKTAQDIKTELIQQGGVSEKDIDDLLEVLSVSSLVAEPVPTPVVTPVVSLMSTTNPDSLNRIVNTGRAVRALTWLLALVVFIGAPIIFVAIMQTDSLTVRLQLVLFYLIGLTQYIVFLKQNKVIRNVNEASESLLQVDFALRQIFVTVMLSIIFLLFCGVYVGLVYIFLIISVDRSSSKIKQLLANSEALLTGGSSSIADNSGHRKYWIIYAILFVVPSALLTLGIIFTLLSPIKVSPRFILETQSAPPNDTLLASTPYINTRYGISFTPPKGWRESKTIPQGLIIQFDATPVDDVAGGQNITNINVAGTSDSGLSLSGYASDSQKQFSLLLSSYQATESTQITVGGELEALIGGTYQFGKVMIQDEQIIIIKNHHVLVVTGTAPQSSWDAQKQKIHASLLSAKFN